MPLEPNIALETIRSLATGRQLESYSPGEVIYSQGDPGSCLYAISEGTVRIDWGMEIYEVLGPGDCFGFDVMVDPQRLRYCSASAESTVVLLPMNREHFLLAIQEFPMFALESLQILDERLLRARAINRHLNR